MAKTAFPCHRLPGVIFPAVFSLVWLLGTCPAGAADDKTSESLQSNEQGQQQIQSQAQELAAQLRAMSAEFERNGLKGDEVKTLNLLSESISAMSEQDMARVIGLLRQARTVGDRTGVLQQVAAAYSGQKSLTVQMKGLLSQYQKDQAAANVAAALVKLAERQTANLQTGITVAQWSPGKKADDAQTELKAALEVQGSEQAALRDEAKQASAKLQAVARDASDPTDAAKAQEAIQKFNQLNAQLDQATTDLKDGHVFKALTSEKQARDGMRQLARDLTPLRETPADALRQTEKEMASMIAQQKEMLDQTKKILGGPKDAGEWAAKEMNDPKSAVAKMIEKENLQGQSADQLKENKRIQGAFNKLVAAPKDQQLSALESKANELANRSDLVSQDLQKDAAQAAAAVKAAQEKMQAAQTDLDDHNAASALGNQQAAIAQMEQAQKQVKAQIAAQDAAQSADRMTQLQAAKQQTQQLAAQQNAATQQQAAQPQAGASNAAQEKDLKNKAQAVQDKVAQAQAPAAAAAIQQAVAQMQKAAESLKQPNGQAQAQAAGAAAAAALQKANAELDKNIAQTAAAQQQLQQVDQALATLEKIISGQEKVQADTVLASSRSTPAAPAAADKRAAKTPAASPVAASVGIATRQADLKTNTVALAQTLTAAEVQSAVDPLNSAQNQMELSRGALAASTPVAARGAQRFAMTSLLQAKEFLNTKKSQLAQQTSPAAAQAAADQQAAQVADQIAQAQAQAATAQAQLAQAQPQSQPPPSQPQAGQPSQQGQPPPSQPQAGQPSQQGQPPQGAQPQGAQPQTAQQGQPPSAPQQGGPQTAQTQSAQQSLEQAANAAGQAAANSTSGPMSDALKQSLAAAQQALNQAASAAAQGDQATAQAQTAQAQQALAQAQGQAQAAQSGLAQAGQPGAMPPGGAPAGGPPPGGQPGAPQAGQAGGPPTGQPGAKGGPKGPAQPGGPQQAANGDQPGVGGPDGQSPTGTSNDPRDASKIGAGSVEKGARVAGKQGSAFAALPARDRAALQQSQAEKYPQEYGAMIEQYMQSLADQPGS